MSFYDEIYKLKNVLRKGWLMRGAKNASTGRVESDAEHTFSMCMLAMEIMSKKNLELDQLKVYKLILVHELCEIDAGDHTPLDNITLQEKHFMEEAGMVRLSNEYDMPELLALWNEFEENSTPEAKFAKQIDRLDAIKQSQIYAKEINSPKLFEEFYDHAKDKIKGLEEFV